MRGISLIVACVVLWLAVPYLAGHAFEEPAITPISGELDLLSPVNGYGRVLLKVEGESLGKPVLVDKTVYVAGGHTVFGLDAATGQKMWQFTSPDANFGLTATARQVFVGSGRTLIALDAATANVLWKYNGDIPVNDPKIVDDLVLINTLDGPVAIDQKTGKLRWKLAIQWGYFVFSPLSEHRLCVWKPDEIYVIETEQGKTLWQSAADQSVSAPGALPTAAVADGELICQLRGTPKDADDWSLYARDVAGGHPIWKTPLGQREVTGVRTMIGGKSVYCVLEEQLSAIDLADGKLKWQTTIKPMEAGGASLVTSKGQLYLPELGGEILTLDEATGKPKWIAAAPKPAEKGQIRIAGLCVGEAGIYVTRNEQVR